MKSLYEQMLDTAANCGMNVISEEHAAQLIAVTFLYGFEDSVYSDKMKADIKFAFGLAAEIEREMISRRTKEALAKKRAEGVVLGRPIGKKSGRVKLSGKEVAIQTLLNAGAKKSQIAKMLKVDRNTLDNFIRERMMSEYERSQEEVVVDGEPTMNCERCGKLIKRNSHTQKYCQECRKEVVREGHGKRKVVAKIATTTQHGAMEGKGRGGS